jgi:hypothetical protein
MSARPPPGPNPSSEAASPAHSRSASVNSLTINQHAPLTPSGLRETQILSVSPNETVDEHAEASGSEISPGTSPAQVGHFGRDSVSKLPTITAEGEDEGDEVHEGHDKGRPADENRSLLGQFGARADEVARETTALLRRPIEFVTNYAHPGPCNHGTFSPQPNSRAASIRSSDGNKNGRSGSGSRGIFGGIADGLASGGSNVTKKMSTTARLAEEHGIKNSRTMYVSYLVLEPLSKAMFKGTLPQAGSTLSSVGSVSDRVREQVLHLLHSIFCVDQAIQVGIPSW